MAKTKPSLSPGKQDDPANVIAFHTGTEWSSQVNLDLNSHLVMHPSATFFLRVRGNSPDHGAIRDGDVLIVDRARTPAVDSTIIAVIDGVLVIIPYRLLAHSRKQGESGNQPDSSSMGEDPAVWGVVTYAIHKL